MPIQSTLATTVLSLLITFSLVHAQSGLPSGCPAAVSIENGGFESGQFTPWTTPSADSTQPTLSIVSPGYQSQYALQMEFLPANVTSWFFWQNIGLQCEGSQYVTSFALNWMNFSIHGNPNENFCSVGVTSSYCDPILPPTQGYYNATNATGWQYHSYTCTARKSGLATFDVNIGCIATYIIPAFTWQMDDFGIKLVGTSTPSQSSSAPSSFISSAPPNVTLSATMSSTNAPISAQSLSTQSSFTSNTPSSVSLTATTSSINIPIPLQSSGGPPSVTLSATTSSTNVPIPLQSSSAPPSVTSKATMSSTSAPIPSAANEACRALEIDFLLGPIGLVLLLPHLLYQLLYAG